MIKTKHNGLYRRASDRTRRHGNWRQVFIDCGGMCIARINGEVLPCGSHDSLELHEVWGENHNNEIGKLSQRILLCNHHHGLIGGHRERLIHNQVHSSMLFEDVMLEQTKCGGYRDWVALYELDDSRFGACCFDGPYVTDEELHDDTE
jgi:hypothetical protein